MSTDIRSDHASAGNTEDKSGTEIRRRRRKNRRKRTPQLRRLLRPAKRPLIHGHQRLAQLGMRHARQHAALQSPRFHQMAQ